MTDRRPRRERLPAPNEVEELLSWLAVEKGRSPNTLAAYRRDLAAYVEFLTGRGLTIDSVTERVVEDYLAFLRAAGRAPASVARALVSVRALHGFLEDEGQATTNPAGDVGRPRVPAGLPKALSEEQVELLLGAVSGDDAAARRDRAILEVLYGCGLRVLELVGLSLSDVDVDVETGGPSGPSERETGGPSGPSERETGGPSGPSERETSGPSGPSERESGVLRAFGKGSKERVVPVGRMARRVLREWLAPPGRAAMAPTRWARRGDAEALFLNARGGRLSRQGAWRIVHGYGAKVGLADVLTPHVLRHSCATHMLDHGADIRVVQELLGHASISTTQIYTKVSTERLRRVYDEAHPRARGRGHG